jgi:hypothetical protein
VVPFAAVTAFADPSVRFGLQFDVEATEGLAGEGQSLFEGGSDDKGGKDSGTTDEGEEPEAEDAKPKGEKVVTLDAFRKK